VVLVSFIANLQLEEGEEEESLIIAKNDLERLEEGCVHRHPRYPSCTERGCVC